MATRGVYAVWRSRLPTSQAIAFWWSAPDVSISIASNGSVETIGEYRKAQTASRSSAAPSTFGSACCDEIRHQRLCLDHPYPRTQTPPAASELTAVTTRCRPLWPTSTKGLAPSGAAPSARIMRSIAQVARNIEPTLSIARIPDGISTFSGAAADQFDKPARHSDPLDRQWRRRQG
ncbi:hypothetical protein [Rhodopseudomonas pseudopalustris]|uniref:hypothetical protein n=1 Tax=Rhodopseudomonas pseudopalustris TaxID=1513892 RepID=UPI001588158C